MADNTPGDAAGKVFDSWPGGTPQYAKNQGLVRDDFRETMARMFLWLNGPTFARFKAVTAAIGGRTLALADNLAASEGHTGGGFGYVEFLMQSASHPLQEKVDVVDTLADHFAAYSFGQNPPVFSYEVALLNSKQNDQANNMFRLYRDILRATSLASLRAELHLQYNNMIVSGVPLSFSWSLSAADESYCPGSFSLLVRKVTLLDNPVYKGPVRLTTSVDATTLATLVPKTIRGVAGTAVQMVQPQPVAPVPAPAAAAPAPASPPPPAPAAAPATKLPPPPVEVNATAVQLKLLSDANAAFKTGAASFTTTLPNGTQVALTPADLTTAITLAENRLVDYGRTGIGTAESTLFRASMLDPKALDTASAEQKEQVSRLRSETARLFYAKYEQNGGARLEQN